MSVNETTNENTKPSCKIVIEGYPSIIKTEKDAEYFRKDLQKIEYVYMCPIEVKMNEIKMTYESNYTPYIIASVSTIAVLAIGALIYLGIKSYRKGK